MKNISLQIILLCCIFGFSGCSEKPKLTTDRITLSNFQANRARFKSLVTQCFNAENSNKSNGKVTCINKLNSAEVKIEDITIRQPGQLLFVFDRYINKSLTDTLVYEKGYAYTNKPIEDDLVKAINLDDFPTKELADKANPEIWRYREIEPNWYIYYRYFYKYTDNTSTEYKGE